MSTQKRDFTQSPSTVSWAAVIAGVTGALGLSLILSTFSAGIGFNVMSSSVKKTAASLTVTAAIWISIAQWIPAALGGYISGRFGKNTSYCGAMLHGFLSWVIATFLMATLLTSTLTSLVSGAAKTASISLAGVIGTAGAVGGGTAAAMKDTHAASEAKETASDVSSDLKEYLMDKMLRSNQTNSTPSTKEESRKEIERIIVEGIKDGKINKDDRSQLVKIIANKAGISPEEANKRVEEGMEKMKEAKEKVKEGVDTARKSVEGVFFFLFFALAVGAVISCVTAGMGGRKAMQNNY